MPTDNTFVTSHFARVRDFMVKAKQECPQLPTIPSADVRKLRAKLILEEALETIKALGITLYASDELVKELADPTVMTVELGETSFDLVPEGECDIVGVADGCADVSVVTIGTLIAFGIPDRRLLELVDNNNLAKFGPGHSIREDGKLIKPPGHKPPDVRWLLKQLGWKDPTDETQILPAVGR